MKDNHINIQVLLANQPLAHVVVTVVDRRGSAPQDLGAKAIMTKEGLYWGTVGGGKVEAFAIRRAAELLEAESCHTVVERVNLTKDLGMTCGGEVRLLFEVYGNQFPWRVAVFGAGHVGQALVHTLAGMACQVDVYDPRQEWIQKLPECRNLQTTITDNMADEVRGLPDHCQLVIVTRGHSHDVPVLEQALLARRFSYIGVIGSQSKGNRLRKALRERGLSEEAVSQFYCPIGLPFGTSDPKEISISIVSQLLWHRDRRNQQLADKWRTKPSLEQPCPN